MYNISSRRSRSEHGDKELKHRVQRILLMKNNWLVACVTTQSQTFSTDTLTAV